MARLIDADALYKALKERQDACLKWFDSAKEDDIKDIARGSINAFIEIKLIIEKLPTIDAEPVRHGKWIGKPIGGYSDVKCSACGDVFLENNGKWKYCPHCGAKMDGEDNEENKTYYEDNMA